MQYQQLVYVLEAAKEQSFSNAAKKLYISQPSLSQQIIALEKELGVPLFVRHSRSVSLTDAGRQFVASAQRIVNEYDQISSVMNDYSLQKSGTIRIGLLWVADYLGITDILKLYQSENPGIRYKLQINGSLELLKELEEREIDAAFLIAKENEIGKRTDLYSQEVLRDDYVVVISKENPLSAKEEISISDLREQTIIMPLPNSNLSRQLEEQFRIHKIQPHVLCESNHTSMNLKLAGSNMAVFFCSSYYLGDLAGDKVRFVPLREKMTRSIYYATLRELQEYPLIRSFSEFVGTHMSEVIRQE